MLKAKILQLYAVDAEFEIITKQTKRIESIVNSVMVLKERSLTSKYLENTGIAQKCTRFLGHMGPVGAYRVAQRLGSPELAVNYIEKKIVEGYGEIRVFVDKVRTQMVDLATRSFLDQWCKGDEQS